jgi:hypothetical protein
MESEVIAITELYAIVGDEGIGWRQFPDLDEADQHAGSRARTISKVTISNGEIISTETVKRIR